MRAHHLTMPGWLFEVRLRADGDYDTRVVGEDEPCERGISRAYVEAEYVTLPPFPRLPGRNYLGISDDVWFGRKELTK